MSTKPFPWSKRRKADKTSSCPYYHELTALTQLDVDLVCGQDHGRVLVGGRWRREAGVGWRCIPWVTDSLDEV